jgi:hypothetical protein
VSFTTNWKLTGKCCQASFKKIGIKTYTKYHKKKSRRKIEDSEKKEAFLISSVISYPESG